MSNRNLKKNCHYFFSISRFFPQRNLFNKCKTYYQCLVYSLFYGPWYEMPIEDHKTDLCKTLANFPVFDFFQSLAGEAWQTSLTNLGNARPRKGPKAVQSAKAGRRNTWSFLFQLRIINQHDHVFWYIFNNWIFKSETVSNFCSTGCPNKLSLNFKIFC